MSVRPAVNAEPALGHRAQGTFERLKALPAATGLHQPPADHRPKQPSGHGRTAARTEANTGQRSRETPSTVDDHAERGLTITSDTPTPPARHIPALTVGSARGAWTARRVLARLVWFPPAATSIRACGSPAHGSPTFFTAGIRLISLAMPGAGVARRRSRPGRSARDGPVTGRPGPTSRNRGSARDAWPHATPHGWPRNG